ncbi:MerR family transcriptional regulator [Massilia eurypsychrophila]|jgi:DNA-binding transcriptional MerR regulator|uniref:MerR family transcriptional regulator n=1 Tax=Massilia eurypsychrophila TaxID=1485217 RepID=A0A2G8TIH2_9BURK|nr:MerR family transcriptional regulator [Massilia eurypsychrophila]PIL45832.1 MerR family transcriptional regulator [Massilia eurypsychrophila]
MNDRPSKTDLIVLPAIPAKRYFTIGEVSELCGVKPHVLRYWEQEFTQLKPVKRRGNRRYYQHHEVLLIRRIRELLYEQGFTISGARNKLDSRGGEVPLPAGEDRLDPAGGQDGGAGRAPHPDNAMIRAELSAILALLKQGV